MEPAGMSVIDMLLIGGAVAVIVIFAVTMISKG